jgi:hypothetical protein
VVLEQERFFVVASTYIHTYIVCTALLQNVDFKIVDVKMYTYTELDTTYLAITCVGHHTTAEGCHDGVKQSQGAQVGRIFAY